MFCINWFIQPYKTIKPCNIFITDNRPLKFVIFSSGKSIITPSSTALSITESSDISLSSVISASPPSSDALTSLSDSHAPVPDSLSQCQLSCESFPTPRHVTDSELQVLRDCLRRWRTEVENDVRGNVAGHSKFIFPSVLNLPLHCVVIFMIIIADFYILMCT